MFYRRPNLKHIQRELFEMLFEPKMYTLNSWDDYIAKTGVLINPGPYQILLVKNQTGSS